VTNAFEQPVGRLGRRAHICRPVPDEPAEGITLKPEHKIDGGQLNSRYGR